MRYCVPREELKLEYTKQSVLTSMAEQEWDRILVRVDLMHIWTKM